MLTLAIFSIWLLVEFLVWLALAAMSFWVWKGGKATASLLTMIGACLLSLTGLLPMIGVYTDYGLFVVAGSVLVVLGYYFTVKPIVDKRIADLKGKPNP